RRGVVLRDREEQRVLVLEMVEDRAPGQPDLLLEAAYRGALVAVSREAGAGAGEDLLTPGVELVLAHPGHAVEHNPYGRLARSLPVRPASRRRVVAPRPPVPVGGCPRAAVPSRSTARRCHPGGAEPGRRPRQRGARGPARRAGGR